MFGRKLLTTDLTTYGFDRKKLNIFTNRGVAQLVAREVWDFDAVGSNPATPTKKADLTVKKRSDQQKISYLSPEVERRNARGS